MNRSVARSRQRLLERPSATCAKRWLSTKQASGEHAEAAPRRCGSSPSGSCLGGAAHGAERRTNREIAEALFLSEGTVKQYINRIYSKLQLTGSAQEKRRALIGAVLQNY